MNETVTTDALRLRLQGLTYAAIGLVLGFSRQRAQQILSPPPKIRDAVIDKARGRCEGCRLVVGRSGHIHHKERKGLECDTYQDPANLSLLCTSCHQSAHAADPRAPGGKRSMVDHEASLEVRGDLARRVAEAGSQRAVAKMAGVSDSYLADVLRGRRTPGPAILRYIRSEIA